MLDPVDLFSVVHLNVVDQFRHYTPGQFLGVCIAADSFRKRPGIHLPAIGFFQFQRRALVFLPFYSVSWRLGQTVHRCFFRCFGFMEPFQTRLIPFPAHPASAVYRLAGFSAGPHCRMILSCFQELSS